MKEAAQRGDSQQLPTRQWGRHHLMVMDAPDGKGLAAAALLVIQRARGSLSMLVVDKRHLRKGLEREMTRHADLICRVFGVKRFEVSISTAA